MRKTYFLFIVIVAVSTINTILGMSQQTSLAHLLIQIKAVKRTWDEERVRIQIAKKASPVLYQKISPLFEKIIASTDFNNKMNTAVDEQVEAIANQGNHLRALRKISHYQIFLLPQCINMVKLFLRQWRIKRMHFYWGKN